MTKLFFQIHSQTSNRLLLENSRIKIIIYTIISIEHLELPAQYWVLYLYYPIRFLELPETGAITVFIL